MKTGGWKPTYGVQFLYNEFKLLYIVLSRKLSLKLLGNFRVLNALSALITVPPHCFPQEEKSVF